LQRVARENNALSMNIMLPNANPNMATAVMIKGTEMTLLCFLNSKIYY
jgi:hypothetical protein